MYISIVVLLILLIRVSTNFRPASTGRVAEGLFAVRCGVVNFYAYDTGAGVLLFDAGTGEAAAVKGLAKVGVNPEDVTHVFFTHSDFDHVGGAGAFTKAKRYLSRAETPLVSGQLARRLFLRNRPPAATRLLNDGDVVTVGKTEVKACAAPGHTVGSVVYVINGSIAVTGDLLRLTRRGGLKPFSRLSNMNHKRDAQSLAALAPALEGMDYILTGHTGIFQRGTNK